MARQISHQYDTRVQDARRAQRHTASSATRRDSGRDAAALPHSTGTHDAYLPGLPRSGRGPSARGLGLTATVALLLLNPAAAAIAHENLRGGHAQLPRGSRRGLSQQPSEPLSRGAARRLQSSVPALAPGSAGATALDADAQSMTFGLADNVGQNATALACTPASCEPVAQTPNDLVPTGQALNDTLAAPQQLETALRIVSQLARKQSASDPQVSALATKLIAELRSNPVLANVAAAVSDSMSGAVWGFVNALVTRVKPGVKNPANLLAATEEAMQALYPDNTDIAVFALQAMAQNGTLAHFIVPQNETLAQQPEARGFAVSDNATTFVSPFTPQQPWLDVAMTRDNATRADFRRSALGQLTGNFDTVLDRTPTGNSLPAAWGGKSVAQALMNCFVDIQGVGERYAVDLLPAGTPNNATGLFAAGASTFTGQLGSLVVGDGLPPVQGLLSQINTTMASANVTPADQATVRAAYDKAVTLIATYSPDLLSDGAAPLSGTEPLVVRDGGMFMAQSGKRFTGFGVNVDDIRACGALQGRTTAEVKRRISTAFAQPGINFVRLPLQMPDASSTVMADPAYWSSVQEIVAHVGTFPGKYIELSVWHEADLASNAGPSWGTLDTWMFMKDLLIRSPHVIAGLVNEPTDYKHNDMLQLHGAFQIMIHSLRAAGVHNVIAVPGSQYARILTDHVAHPFTGGNVISELHAYGTLDQVRTWKAPCLKDVVCIIAEAAIMDDPDQGVSESPADFTQMMVEAHEEGIPFAAWDYSGVCAPNLLTSQVEAKNSGNGQKLALSDYGELFFGMARNLTERGE